MPEHNDPYAAARHHVGLAIEFLKLSESDAERLRSRHEAAMRYDLDAGLTYADGAKDTGDWLRGLEKSEPSLLGKAPTLGRTTAQADLHNATLTELFAGNARGDAAATAELNRRSLYGDGTPAPVASAPFNVTNHLIRARAGDAEARAALDHFFSRN